MANAQSGMRGVKLLAATAGLNLMLWFAVQTVRGWIDPACAGPARPENPYIIRCLQEALVYMAPWPAVVILQVGSLLPLKMLGRWLCDLKNFVAIPESFFQRLRGARLAAVGAGWRDFLECDPV